MSASKEESQKHPLLLRIPFRFEEYRKEKIFVDCTYTINQKTFNAHKIILSKFSKLYFNFFCNNKMSKVPIPFGEDAFNMMVDFFYTGTISLPLEINENLIKYLAMSIIYDSHTLYEIIMPIIEKFLSEDTDVRKVFSLTKQFKKLKLTSEDTQYFPEIYDNFEKFLEKQKEFVSFIVKNFTELTKNNMDDFFKSVSPFLLSEILKNMHFSNEMNAHIVDKCMDTVSEITEKEKTYLQSIIDWNDNDAYLLFLNNKMEWVTPDVSRPHLERIFNARSVSSQSFLEMSKSLCSNNQSNKISNWWTIQQCQFIRNSKEDKEQSEFEAMHFIGTIGNKNDSYFNPISFKLINPDCSPNLPEDEYFGIQNILDDDPETYYLSYPKEEEVNPYIGISFLKSTFKISRIEVESVPDRKEPKTVQFIINDISYGTAKMEKSIAVLDVSGQINANKITVKMVDPVSLPFRVRSLRVFGKFNAVACK